MRLVLCRFYVLRSHIRFHPTMGYRLHLDTGKSPHPFLSEPKSEQAQVGCLMMRQIVNVNWKYIGDAVPAFVTVMFIPFGYSAAYGLIAGLLTYTALNGLIYLTKLISRGYIAPIDEDSREYWTREFAFL
jgi:hypothetical protein